MPFVASGSYGCVFKPHLPCDNTTSRIKGSVGKVFEDPRDFKLELKVIEDIIEKVDPNHEFTLPMLMSCDVNTSKIVKRDNISSCPLMTGLKQKQLIIKDGGKSLDELISSKSITKTLFLKLVKLSLPIMKGIVKLGKHGYIHQDIKPDNILYDKHKLHLIDFGIVSKLSTHYKKPLRTIYKADYPYFPPEYKLFSKTYKKADEFVADVLQNFMFTMTLAGHTLNIPSMMHQELGINFNDELLHLWNTTLIPSETLALKVDVYQMGMTLFFVWCAIKNKPRDHKLKQIIAKMVHPNVIKRCTMEEAFNELSYVLA
jgi:serine/threonine protein kinase